MKDYSIPVTQLILNRSSWRKYLKVHVDQNRIDQLQQYSLKQQKGIWGAGLRFKVLSSLNIDSGELQKMTTYGLISNPRGFVTGLAAKSPTSLEEFGYAMEKIVLFATDLGLGNCWLGGTFAESLFADKLSPGENEEIAAVVSFGIPTPRRGLTDSMARLTVGAKKRKPWSELFFDETFDHSLDKESSGDYKDILEMVRLAPSASNKQPWRIIRNGQGYHLYLERTPGYIKNIDKLGLADIQRVDMGIAMCHFELTAFECGKKGRWLTGQKHPESGDREYVATWLEE